MNEISFDPHLLTIVSLKLFLAMALTLPTAWERERATGVMGLRTFPLVATASCAYVIAATSMVGEAADAQSRVLQGLMTGIGFIGGGAILKESGSVRGTATAASIWMTGAVGAAVGYGHLEIALPASLLNFFMLFLLTPSRRRTMLLRRRHPRRSTDDE